MNSAIVRGRYFSARDCGNARSACMGFPLIGRGVFWRLPPDVVGCLLGGTGSGDDKARIRLEFVNPASEICGRIANRGLFDACGTAQHGATHFRHELFFGIILGAEWLYFLDALAP